MQAFSSLPAVVVIERDLDRAAEGERGPVGLAIWGRTGLDREAIDSQAATYDGRRS
jgi:hypothetical protein